jgi:hypothetical protein
VVAKGPPLPARGRAPSYQEIWVKRGGAASVGGERSLARVAEKSHSSQGRSRHAGGEALYPVGLPVTTFCTSLRQGRTPSSEPAQTLKSAYRRRVRRWSVVGARHGRLLILTLLRCASSTAERPFCGCEPANTDQSFFLWGELVMRLGMSATWLNFPAGIDTVERERLFYSHRKRPLIFIFYFSPLPTLGRSPKMTTSSKPNDPAVSEARAFLFDDGGHQNPRVRLAAMGVKVFVSWDGRRTVSVVRWMDGRMRKKYLVPYDQRRVRRSVPTISQG